MSGNTYGPGEIALRGESIYRERIRKVAKPANKGNFVVIDVESGDYEVDSSDAAATRRLLERKPGAVTYGICVGHRAAYGHLGEVRNPRGHG